MRPSPLVQFTLNGLKHCRMPERRLWSFKYHLDGREQPNEARPSYDVFYSLNVLLGLSKTPEAARMAFGLAPDAMFQQVASRLNGAAPGAMLMEWLCGRRRSWRPPFPTTSSNGSAP